MRMFVRLFAQALTIVLLIGASSATAQQAANPTAKARARELYTQGQQLFRSGDFTTAQRAFEDAYKAVPNPVVLLSIAECQVRNEDFEGAVASLHQYLNEKPNAPDRAQVESQIAGIEAKPGTVNIESTPPGAVIWVDGENTGYLTPNEISVRSGTHTVALSSPGYQNAEQTIDVRIGSRQRLSLSMTPEAPPAVAEQPPTPEQAPMEEDLYPRRRRYASPAVWSMVAVAGVTALVGTGLGIKALKMSKDYEDDPTGTTQSELDKGSRMALFADVSFGIAIVSGVTGLVLYLTSNKTEAPTSTAKLDVRERPRFQVAPELSPHRLGLSGQLSF